MLLTTINCLLILIVNISVGLILCSTLKFYLFYPRKIFLFGKYGLSCTPGLLFRYKNTLISYLHIKLKEYRNSLLQEYRNINFLTDLEKKIYHELYPYLQKFLHNTWIPDFIRYRANIMLSNLFWMLIRFITRNIIPRLLVEYQIEYKIDLLDLKLDIYELKNLFIKHVYNYLLIFNICFFFIIGIINMVLYLIL